MLAHLVGRVRARMLSVHVPGPATAFVQRTIAQAAAELQQAGGISPGRAVHHSDAGNTLPSGSLRR